MKFNKYLTVLALAAFATVHAAADIPENTYRIVEKVRKEIVTLSSYGVFDSIRFSIDGDTVILKGEASRPTLKTSAEKVVSKIEGVERVVNEIEVLPNSRNDERIRAEAYLKIYRHATLSRYSPNRGMPMRPSMVTRSFGPSLDPPMVAHPIHIVVKNGVLTLEGVVDNAMDKNLAEMQARTVNGAFQVVNNRMIPAA